jgi:diadenosine tetraphosphate (Ap4A) HIT family hydrolase
MTSFMISQFIDRIPEYTLDDGCIFCKIIRRESPAHIVYEDAQVIAFLDTLPIRPGHTLLVPKAHHARLTDLPPELASALGVGLTKIGDAVAKGQ